MQRVGKQVAAALKVNPKMIFIGGFSLGGGWTYRLSNRDPTVFAGIIPMGMSGGVDQNKAAAYSGKPVLIAHGETDEYCQGAAMTNTLDSYKKVGAAVTHEVFKGQGHTVDTKNAVVKQWLLDQGPLKAVRLDLETAKAAEKAGKLGQAHAMYVAVAKVENGGEYAKTAASAAKAMSDVADKRFAEADAAVSGKKYADAIRALSGVEKTYAGSALAERAKEQLAKIQSDPAIKGELEQAKIDATADAMEAQAQSMEKAKDYPRAIAIYEKYVTEHPKATRFAEVKKRLDALKGDKTIQAGIAGKQMETDCKGWMKMADNYLNAGFKDKAAPYLQKIVDKYPTSEYAKEAKKKLAK